MPLLQTIGSDALRTYGFGLAVAAQPVYELISTTTLGSSQANVVFTLTGGNQASYKHLQLRVSGRTTDAQAYADLYLRFNGDSGTNYGWHYIAGPGSTPTSGYSATQTGVFVGRMSGNTSAASNFGAAVCDIVDAFSGNKYKVTRMLGGEQDPSYNQVLLTSGMWANTAAISTITLFSNQGGSLAANSRFSLYGVRG
jgi:hypothetical protein